MDDAVLTKAELARRFAAEVDAIALQGAAPDCAAQMAAFHAAVEAECTGLREQETTVAPTSAGASKTARR